MSDGADKERHERRVAATREEADATPILGPSAGLPVVITQGRALALPDVPLVLRRPGLIARLVAWLTTLIEEEVAYGHGFLFWPVLIGLGALLWFCGIHPPQPVSLALLICVLCMAVSLFRHRHPLLHAFALTAALIVAGALAAALESWRMSTVLLDAPVTTTVTGIVHGRELDSRGHWRYQVALVKTHEPALFRMPETVSLLSRGRAGPVAIGGMIEGRARLSPPSGPALIGANDFGFDGYFAGNGAVGYFYGTPRDLGPGPPEGLFQTLLDGIADLRAQVGAHIRGLVAGSTGALAAALVTGEERAIDPALVDAMRLSGLGHVLAISGLNMALAAGTLLVGLRTGLSLFPGFAQRYPVKKVAAVGALIMVTLYMMIAGGAVSAVRSFVMIVVMLIAVFVDRPSISLRNIALSGVLILLVTPSAVTGPGFQMSFAATLALVALYRRLEVRADPGESAAFSGMGVVVGLWQEFRGLVLSSLIGGVSTMIYSAAHFHRIPAYGLIANVLALPVVGAVVMPGALVAMLVMPFGLDGLVWMVVAMGLDWMNWVARLVAGWGGQIETGRLAPMAFALIAFGGVLICLLRTVLALSGLVVVLAGLVVAVLSPPPRPAVLVSEDGRMVALIDHDKAALNRTKPPAFIYDQWRRALVVKAGDPPIMVPALSLAGPRPAPVAPQEGRLQRTNGRERPPLDLSRAGQVLAQLLQAGGTGRFACVARQWCAAVSVQGWRIVTLEDVRLAPAACDGADLVVAPQALRDEPLCASGPAEAATGATLRRSGALEIHAAPKAECGLRMQAQAAVPDLSAPWARHRLYDWRSRSFKTPEPEDNPDNGDQDNLAPVDGFSYEGPQ
ncbi:hypothetical protein BJF93_10570 [Xaviernesmea oryzae]|uniref:ComEC/Rec2-related protein domain-containing protein n=1 Tax=Xaviernesmea oryzae TaxID=464029 RepID=A0A1Q9AX53_9HYPH|nr:ComEC/Rec2 family competence protein [Xaviernesmea oryzae]OLP60011.1 hypothetical protein BJF93_10570 [Xaviernesmea oryzae]SEK40290.1 ComEC/Rec2-related protein [Xaviernesmea oryzae]